MKTNQRNSISAHSIMERFYPSPLGILRITFDESALLGLSFDEPSLDTLSTDKPISTAHSTEEHFSDTISSFPQVLQSQPDPPIFRETKRWLDLYFSGHQPDFIPSFRITTTPFRHLVYDILLNIPYSQTKTYGDIAIELAKRLHRPTMSAQAVGNAVAQNPLLLLIPCHRVVGAKGALTGYAGGLQRKAQLLAWERRWKER